MAIDPELLWLRPRVICMRALLRYAKDDRVETALKDLIGDAENRLEALEEQARETGRDHNLRNRPAPSRREPQASA